MIPPKPAARPDRVPLWRHLRLYRQDILSAQPERLYRAWMAEFRSPFFRSFLCNDPTLVVEVLETCPEDFPKSGRLAEGLRPLLGDSVFLTNGEDWRRQRRIIDPAFAGGRLRELFGAMLAAGESAAARLAAQPGVVEIEPFASHLAADIIFRTLFSRTIEDRTARAVYDHFRIFQREQPLLNAAAFFRLPRWMPRLHSRGAVSAAREIRRLISDLVHERAERIAEGTAPDDLATRIMTTPDPVTGRCFSPAEMVDQVAIFFLAGHETSATALAWAIYLCACDPDLQDRIRDEAELLAQGADLSAISRLRVSRDVFRETLRLYPPVPMMVRESRCPAKFRGRSVPTGSQIVISPWHMQRHERLWERPDVFDPGRWSTEAGRAAAHRAYLPFSKGPRICPGAGFAMVEGPLMLSVLIRALRFAPVEGKTPVPVAYLTVRSRDGIFLRVHSRNATKS